MAHLVKFDLQLPKAPQAPLPAGADDLAKGVLTVTRSLEGTSQTDAFDLPVTKDEAGNYSYDGLTPDENGQVYSAEVMGDKGTETHAEFVWEDDDGNKSKNPAVADITLVDQELPPDADGLGFRLKGEVPH